MSSLGGALLVCGTSSDAGKSLMATAICRAFARRGLSVAPFKAMNMSLNSGVTVDGGEIATAQLLQALASGVEAERVMNPVLLKPAGERASQLVLLGRPDVVADATDFTALRRRLRPLVLDALSDLRARFDVVVIEGAGAAAEPNLLEDDFVNLGLAAAADVDALVVGDIDRGGVFAALYGTVALLPNELSRHIRGYVINKFRGDPALLAPAIEVLSERSGLPCLGIVPMLGDLGLAAEDSLGLRFLLGGSAPAPGGAPIDVAVVALPHLANFNDFDPLSLEPGVQVRFVTQPGALGDPDLVVVPGSKATVADLSWLRAVGFADALARAGGRGSTLLGVCAGYQMLGTRIVDAVESAAGEVAGLGLFDVTTTFARKKVTRRRTGRWGDVAVAGYELHHGIPLGNGVPPWFRLEEAGREVDEGVADREAGRWGTSLHGIFEGDALRAAFLGEVARRRNKRFVPSSGSFSATRAAALDRLADALEAAVSVDRLLELARLPGR
ncbi:MAG: cobyric acid synthase [Actinomycetota bacterium]|nr:cobyric acid synthase [Actinomycetota bacterium]